jgi:hypothetical protein
MTFCKKEKKFFSLEKMKNFSLDEEKCLNKLWKKIILNLKVIWFRKICSAAEKKDCKNDWTKWIFMFFTRGFHMNCNLKRFGGLLTTLLVTSSFGFADSGEKSSKSEKKMYNGTENGSKGIYWEGKDEGMGKDAMAVRCFQNCFPTCPDSNFSVQVDFLWWASQYHLPFAIKGTGQTSFCTTDNVDCGLPAKIDVTQINSQIKTVHNGWAPGYRVGLGWNTQFDNWDVRLLYTYYHDSSSRHVRGNSVNVFWQEARGRGRLNYNVGDLEMGRTYYISKYLVFRPFIGLRTAWLDQQFVARSTNKRGPLQLADPGGLGPIAQGVLAFTNLALQAAFDVFPDPARVKVHNDLWGVGPRFGLDTNWGNWHGFSLLANISTALLYGHTWTHASVYLQDGDIDGDGDTDALLLKTKGGYWHGIPTLQTQMGLTWASNCWGCTPCVPCGEKRPERPDQNMMIRFSAAWESNYWWESNNFTAWTNRAVSLQGLTLSAKFDF